jgi:hypothetical protein
MNLSSKIVIDLEKTQVKRKDNPTQNNIDLGNRNNVGNQRGKGCC